MRALLDAITEAPAFVRNDRRDIVVANHLGRALYAPMYDGLGVGPNRPPNTARFIFLDPRAKDFYVDWDRAADNVTAILRTAAGRRRHDRPLAELVAKLNDHSAEFRSRWAAHHVRHHAGRKRYRHR